MAYKRTMGESAADDRQDSELARHMNPAQKRAWKMADSQMDSKPMSRAKDTRLDKAMVAKIKRTVR